MNEDTARRRYLKELKVELTRDERDLKVRELLDENEELTALEEEAKESATDYRTRIKEQAKTCEDLMTVLRQNKEKREVEVEEVSDFAHKEVRTVRLDTGEVISSRTMRSDELQTKIDDGDGAVLDMSGRQLGSPTSADASEAPDDDADQGDDAAAPPA